MDLAIITVSYNTRDLLVDCLASVLDSLERSGLEAELWVVDNASADGSAELVRQRFPAVRLIAHDQNVGFAAGNNLALRQMGFSVPTSSSRNAAGPDDLPRHVLFLNPDTRVLGDAPSRMVRFLDQVPGAGAVGAQLVHGDGSFQHSAFAFPGLAQVLIDFFPLHTRLIDSRLNGRYPRSLYDKGAPFLVDHPLGAALMVCSEVLAQVGGFDERFFMYCEEIDLCRRIRAAGWEIYCLPQARIVHLVGQSTQQFRDRMFVELWRSRYLMFDKHNGPPFRWLVRRLVCLGLWAEARRARAAHRRGAITSEELEGRLQAFHQVAQL
ncbi:MAG: glycosyltransferase family 2 protein [Anaerolineae bacterium]|nr:glycosyltransferase family 2 protein [Anaerolineae bacterium]